MAAVELIGRTGAAEFQFGWLHDNVPFAEAGWYAKARWGGQMVTAEDHVGPVEATDALASKLVEGGMCTHCFKPMTLVDDDPAKCRWALEQSGRFLYKRGCEAEFPDDGPVPTTRKLATALMRRGAPMDMVQRALAGYYDDFKSPLAMPEMQLYHDALAAGLPDIAEMVKDGEFDATKEESAAWARSPDGQATFAELLNGAKDKGKKAAKPKHQGRYTPPGGKGR